MGTFYETAEVSFPDETTVQVRRSFKAPRLLVWRAHTEPALIQRWMLGPSGWVMPVCEMDVRVGGKYLWRWRSEDGAREFGFHGEFTEVHAPAKLAHMEFFDPGDVGGDMGQGSLVTNTLEESGGVTTLTALMDFHTKDSRDAAVATGMTDGMEIGYARLDAMFAKTPA